MTTPTVTKRVGRYDPETKDFPIYIIFEDEHEELIGYAKTHHDADLVASDYILNFYQDNDTPEAAAALIMEELAQEGRHEQAAKDMGGEWEAIDIPSVLEMDEARTATEGGAPTCTSCEGRGVVLDDKEHYRTCLCQYGKGYALGGNAAVRPPTYPPCPCGGPADHHPQRCPVIGALLWAPPSPVNWSEVDVRYASGKYTLNGEPATFQEAARAVLGMPDWERLHAFAASLEKIDPSCPTCGDQVAQEGDFCAACRETGEARYERLLA